jgi:hypothetical protein
MAKWAIFTSQGQIFRLASDDTTKDSFLPFGGESAVAKQVTDSEWNSIAAQNKIVSLVNGSIQIQDPSLDTPSRPVDLSAEEILTSEKVGFENQIKDQKIKIEEYLSANPNDTVWVNYLNNLNSIDVSTVTFPVDSFQKWFNSQSGFSTKNILELP